MKYRRLFNNRHGLAGVIEALLLIALVAIILSFIQMYYVPEIMKQKEADHMDSVLNQFSYLKSVIEIQSMMGSNEVAEEGSAPMAYTPMYSPITLGSDQLPYFVSSASYGSIEVNDRNDVNTRIRLVPNHDDFGENIPLTSIKYHAYNYYFPSEAPWQEYILEGGGIILKQSEGEKMTVNPAITVENQSDIDPGRIKINFFVPMFRSISGKKITSDYDDVYIRTNFSKYYTPKYDKTVSDIYIYTDNIVAWEDFINNPIYGILREYADSPNNFINIDTEETADPPYIHIEPTVSGQIDLELNLVEIEVQIGPGFIDS